MRSLTTQLLKRTWLLYALLAAFSVLFMALVSTVFAPQLSRWEERLASNTWALSSPAATERRVVVVDIDEKSTQALGAWPWPRERMASLLNGLNAYGVNLKVVDVLFDGEQDKTQDAALAQALQAGAPTVISQLFALSPDAQIQSGQLSGHVPGLVGASGLPGNSASSIQIAASQCPAATTSAYGYMAPAAAFVQQGQAVGHISPIVDADGGIRRVPALVCFDGKAYPALAVAALSEATGAAPTLQTQSGLFKSGFALDVGGFELPIDAQGQLRVSYQMPRSGFVSVSAVDVIQGKVPASLLKGAWVLVGSTAFGGGDAVPTPQGGAVGGVEIHAQILSAALDARTPYSPLWAPLWPLITGALALCILIFSLGKSGAKAAWVLPSVAIASIAAIFCAHAALLLLAHQWLAWGQPAMFVAISALTLTAGEMLRVRAERESLYQNLASYLPEQAARRVAFEGPTAQVVAQTREATVMMVDLRNFSAYCEAREPEDAATVLHIFYTTVEQIVTEHGGVVEQMVGDGLTAVWNGSLACSQHAQQALSAARVIWEQGVAQLPKHASRKTPPLDIGIGIESGPVMVGSFGPARRRVHTVMGEAVSVASRLEKLTSELGYPVLVGPRALAISGMGLGSLNTGNGEAQIGGPQLHRIGEFLLAGMRAPRVVYALNVPVEPSHLHLVSSLEAGSGS